jgi:hypothetical protein
MIHLHLDEAYWCENCQCIIDSSKRCPSCANELDLISIQQFMPLIRQRIIELGTPIDLFAKKVIDLGEPFIHGITKGSGETDEQFKRRYELSKEKK